MPGKKTTRKPKGEEPIVYHTIMRHDERNKKGEVISREYFTISGSALSEEAATTDALLQTLDISGGLVSAILTTSDSARVHEELTRLNAERDAEFSAPKKPARKRGRTTFYVLVQGTDYNCDTEYMLHTVIATGPKAAINRALKDARDGWAFDTLSVVGTFDKYASALKYLEELKRDRDLSDVPQTTEEALAQVLSMPADPDAERAVAALEEARGKQFHVVLQCDTFEQGTERLTNRDFFKRAIYAIDGTQAEVLAAQYLRQSQRRDGVRNEVSAKLVTDDPVKADRYMDDLMKKRAVVPERAVAALDGAPEKQFYIVVREDVRERDSGRLISTRWFTESEKAVNEEAAQEKVSLRLQHLNELDSNPYNRYRYSVDCYSISYVTDTRHAAEHFMETAQRMERDRTFTIRQAENLRKRTQEEQVEGMRRNLERANAAHASDADVPTVPAPQPLPDEIELNGIRYVRKAEETAPAPQAPAPVDPLEALTAEMQRSEFGAPNSASADAYSVSYNKSQPFCTWVGEANDFTVHSKDYASQYNLFATKGEAEHSAKLCRAFRKALYLHKKIMAVCEPATPSHESFGLLLRKGKPEVSQFVGASIVSRPFWLNFPTRRAAERFMELIGHDDLMLLMIGVDVSKHRDNGK